MQNKFEYKQFIFVDKSNNQYFSIKNLQKINYYKSKKLLYEYGIRYKIIKNLRF